MAASAPQILDNLATAIMVVAPDRSVRYLNAAAEGLFGFSARAVTGRRTDDLFGDGPLAARLADAIDDARAFTARELPLSVDGGARALTVDLTATPVGVPVDHLLLEFSGLDRHLRITREEHLAAQHAASRSLVRGLAHEIKNPLGGLRGAAQLLERELDEPALHEYTRVIIDEADRLAGLVDTMLGPTRPPHREPVNIHLITDRVLQLVATDGITIVREYDPSLPEVQADADQLVQALLNIARNSVQAMSARGTLTMRTRIERQVTIGRVLRRRVVCVDVIDTGPGIDESVRDQIFFPLVTTRPDGSGLGLSIAQSLVARHGGAIEWASEAGATTFSVFIPLEEGA